MKTSALLLLAAILSAAVHAQDAFHIEQVGLQDFDSVGAPTPVQIHVPAIAESQVLHLLFAFESGDYRTPSQWLRTDHFEKQLQVTAGQPLDMDVPIPLPAAGFYALRAVGIDAQGRTIGQDRIVRGLKIRNGGSPVAIFCRDDSQCLETQAQISPILPTEQDAGTWRQLQFVFLKQLSGDWLVYRAAGAVVIAGSIPEMTSEQAGALEYYVRSGGILILLEKEAADNGFLAAYREGAPGPRPVAVGRGGLYRLSGLQSRELSSSPQRRS